MRSGGKRYNFPINSEILEGLPCLGQAKSVRASMQATAGRESVYAPRINPLRAQTQQGANQREQEEWKTISSPHTLSQLCSFINCWSYCIYQSDVEDVEESS